MLSTTMEGAETITEAITLPGAHPEQNDTPWDDHPLSRTLARVGALDKDLACEVGCFDPASGWFRAEDLAEDNSPYLTEALTRVASRYPGSQPRTRGTLFINEYAWYVPAAAIASYLLDGRVPDLSMHNVALRYRTYRWQVGEESGEVERLDVRFLGAAFATLTGDPHASHPDALPLPDSASLLNWLISQVEGHMAPLVESVYEQTNLGKRAQWNLIADDCAALFQHAGKAMNDEQRGVAEGRAFVEAPASPWRNTRTGFFTLECAGASETFRQRGGCCRYYTLPGKGAQDRCSTCVLRRDDERDTPLLDYMTRTYGPQIQPATD